MAENQANNNISEEKIASFDSAYTSNHIKMLKILAHYLPHGYGKYLAVYIKYLELQRILSAKDFLCAASIRPAPQDTSSQDFSVFLHLIEELLPYCTCSEKQFFEQLEGMLHNFDQIKNMMSMFEMMNEFKDMFQDEDGGFDPQMLAGMMGGMGNMGDMGDFSFFNNDS